MQNSITPNRWREFHKSLESEIAKRYKEQIEKNLCISQSAFYHKIKNPERYLSIAEKQAIAWVYHLKE
jgi:hypothetical protein